MGEPVNEAADVADDATTSTGDEPTTAHDTTAHDTTAHDTTDEAPLHEPVPVPVPQVEPHDDPHVPAQGWYLDPAGDHEQRWFSAGTPTDLVRDEDGTEHHSEAPAGPVPADLVHAPEDPLPDGTDLLRADDVEAVDPDTTIVPETTLYS